VRQPPDLLRPGRATREIHASIDPLAPEWDDLADRTGAPPFVRPGWFQTWLDAFGRGSLEVFAVRRGGRLAAVLPMLRRAGALTSPSNWHTPLFGAVAEPGAEAPLAEALLARRTRFAKLAFVDPEAPFVVACRERAAALGRPLLTRTIERSPYVPVEGTWDDFERSRLSGDGRSTLRNRRRRLMAEGALAVEVTGGQTDLGRRLEEGFEVEARSWKGEAGTAIDSRPDTRRFYTQIARWAADRGFLQLAFLRVEGRPVAFELGIEDGGACYTLKGGYDRAFAHGAPGRLLLVELLARTFAHGLERYEFLGQEEPWKQEWTDTCRERAVVQVFGGGWMGRLERAVRVYGRPPAERIRALGR
jgi:CelD/BcsL family acetyltransferase involved in cellulose biosynthesis